MTKKVIMYATRASGDSGRTQNYEITKDSNGKLAFRKCKTNEIIRNYHRNKNYTESKDSNTPKRRMSRSTMQRRGIKK